MDETVLKKIWRKQQILWKLRWAGAFILFYLTLWVLVPTIGAWNFAFIHTLDIGPCLRLKHWLMLIMPILFNLTLYIPQKAGYYCVLSFIYAELITNIISVAFYFLSIPLAIITATRHIEMLFSATFIINFLFLPFVMIVLEWIAAAKWKARDVQELYLIGPNHEGNTKVDKSNLLILTLTVLVYTQAFPMLITYKP